MLVKLNALSRSTLCIRPTVLQSVGRCGVHYQIGKDGEKVVVSKRHNIRTSREKWQEVRPMGFEKEVRDIMRIENNERLHSRSEMAKMTAESKMTQLRNRLRNAGFCRDRKSYTPPSDLESRFSSVTQNVLSTSDVNFGLTDAQQKFQLLTALATEFDHEINNSMLYQMKTVGDVKEFYETPVRGINSYDHMARQADNLPKNLHIIPEAIRFNPETDTYFAGADAFPGPQSNIVGLRAKKRYEQKPAPFEWPDI